ncbi:KAP family NTPase [Chromobacterium vaccinii]|nr:KAP family NTPase [Chromobacterium vaccinii]MBX9358167.1 KAP family NTPase [Chromobacterium vaccinii]
MTLKHTKEQLTKLVCNPELKVIAFSGAWGTGKTHLWEEIRRESTDSVIKASRYVSLFGVRDINQLKLKVVQSMLPDVAHGNLVTESIGKLWNAGKEALKKVHPAFTAVDELALVAVPAALRNQFVVIDDLERKNAALTVDEVLGFVDEYVERFGTRFLLILNSEKLSEDQDDALWTSFREKVVDDELRFSPTAIEAFDIAVSDSNAPYRASVRAAVEACGLTNIRVIRLTYRLVTQLLGTTPELAPPIQARTVPSIVLIAATYNKAIKDGPDLDFIVSFNHGGSGGLDRYLSKTTSLPDESPEKATPAGWRLLMSSLHIDLADEFEELVVAYIREGRHDIEAIKRIIEGYGVNQAQLEAKNAASALIEKIRWDISATEAELLSEAERCVSHVRELDASTVSVLYDLVSTLHNGESVAESILDAWIEYFEEIKESTKFGDSPLPSFSQRLHPRLKATLEAARKERIQSGTLVDVMLSLVGRDGWGHRDEVTLKAATVEDFLAAMRTLKGQEFKTFILQSLDILEQNQMYEKHFGNAGKNFLEASRQIISTETSSRLGRLLQALFAESTVSALLTPDVS